MMSKVSLLLVTCLILSVACTPQQSTTTEVVDRTAELNAWLDQEFAEYLNFYPLAKSRLGDKSDHDKLNDVGEAAWAAVVEWRLDSVARMTAQFDRATLSAEGQRSFDLWRYLADQEVARFQYRRHTYLFGRRGPNTRLPRNLINDHQVDNASDMEAYIRRLQQTGRYFDQYIERVRAASQEGIRAPYFSYDLAIGHVQAFLAGKPFQPQAANSNAIWNDVQSEVSRLRADDVIDAQQADDLLTRARDALVNVMGPAYQRLLNELQSQRRSVDEDAQGVSQLPEGNDYYAHQLSRMTTTTLSAQAIHDIGVAEVARIQALMRDIARAVDFDGELDDFFAHMRESKDFYLPNTDQGREQYLAQARQFLTAIESRLPQYFGLLPKAALEVRRVEAYREQAGGAAHYTHAAPDGSRPGIFYAHLIDMSAVPVYGLETLSYHEGLPGHHMQIAIAQELSGVPRFRTYHRYTAFSEGWGLYAEYLGKEMGMFTDPYNDFGRLTGELWRAIRLVVDTGIHTKGWSEQRAIDYALRNSPRPETSVRSEVRRYFESPGQATAYKIGMLKIIELRERARETLGSRFDLRAFHDQVLGSGSLPMGILETKIDAWIESVR